MKEKRLFVIRHAKAVQGGYDNDFGRSLAQKAEEQIIQMSVMLKNATIIPDLVLASAALRTQQTADGFAENLGFGKDKIVLKDSIYNTNVTTLIQEINQVSDNINTLFLVAHSPTVGMLVDELTDNFRHHFSTCAIAFLKFNINSWQEVGGGTGSLVWLKETQNN